MDEKISHPDTAMLVVQIDSSLLKSTAKPKKERAELYYSTAVVLGIVLVLFVLFNTRTK